MKFKTPHELTYHSRVHTDERPFVCDECDKKFKSSQDLKQHLRCHTGERPFKCDKCKMSFTVREFVET